MQIRYGADVEIGRDLLLRPAFFLAQLFQTLSQNNFQNRYSPVKILPFGKLLISFTTKTLAFQKIICQKHRVRERTALCILQKVQSPLPMTKSMEQSKNSAIL